MPSSPGVGGDDEEHRILAVLSVSRRLSPANMLHMLHVEGNRGLAGETFK